jgi:hypothetical protein
VEEAAHRPPYPRLPSVPLCSENGTLRQSATQDDLPSAHSRSAMVLHETERRTTPTLPTFAEPSTRLVPPTVSTDTPAERWKSFSQHLRSRPPQTDKEVQIFGLPQIPIRFQARGSAPRQYTLSDGISAVSTEIERYCTVCGKFVTSKCTVNGAALCNRYYGGVLDHRYFVAYIAPTERTRETAPKQPCVPPPPPSSHQVEGSAGPSNCPVASMSSYNIPKVSKRCNDGSSLHSQPRNNTVSNASRSQTSVVTPLLQSSGVSPRGAPRPDQTVRKQLIVGQESAGQHCEKSHEECNDSQKPSAQPHDEQTQLLDGQLTKKEKKSLKRQRQKLNRQQRLESDQMLDGCNGCQSRTGPTAELVARWVVRACIGALTFPILLVVVWYVGRAMARPGKSAETLEENTAISVTVRDGGIKKVGNLRL